MSGKASCRVDASEKSPALLSVSEESGAGEFPTLALTREQFAMVKALDEVGWEKHPVHIHRVRHSHAAIIVRMRVARFDEGKIVVRHFLERFET